MKTVSGQAGGGFLLDEMPHPPDSDSTLWVEAVASASCTVEATVCRHDHGRNNLLANELTLGLVSGVARGRIRSSAWSAEFHAESAGAGTFDLRLRLRCEEGTLLSGVVALRLTFRRWDAANYVLLPGAAYNGNRFAARRIPYPPKLFFPADIGPDKPPVISDVPRLELGTGPSRIQERAGSLAVPAVGFQAPATGSGFLLIAKPANALGEHGIGVEESGDRGSAMITLSSPVVREWHNYRACDFSGPSLDQPHDFMEDDEVELCCRVRFFPAPDIQTLFDVLASCRKDLVPPSAPSCTLPLSACFAVLEEKFNRENFAREAGYYSVGPRGDNNVDWQIGRTGGMISTLPLLELGSVDTRVNVLRHFNWLFPAGISPSGFFWDGARDGKEWIGGDPRQPHTANWHLVRKSADGLWYVLRQFRLMRSIGMQIKDAWQDGVRKVADAFTGLWQRSGQFGQFVDSRDGTIQVGGSAAGALAPAALVLAHDWFFEPKYLEIALAAGEKFFSGFTARGVTNGGPDDALQCPDSESAAALVESYFALFEATGDRNWLARSGAAARQLASWVVAHDHVFPRDSMLAKAGVRATGAVFANVQDKHAAPGYRTFSGLALLKLYRATADPFFAELLRDTVRGMPQYLPHPLKPLGDAPTGHMCDRVNMTDWEGQDRVGETSRQSTWAETSLMLCAAEIPGLYARTDTGKIFAFDNIEAEVTGQGEGWLGVRISNPTPAEASLRILCEGAEAFTSVLAQSAVLNARVEKLAPGESRVIQLPV